MEPPAKRLRLLQSVEVDETNPDYIREKAQAQAQLKSRFESLFAKYENMPESMSDEIDMRTGKVVVDRGHCRRLQRNPHALRRAQFLDDWISDEPEGKVTGDGECNEQDEDELAPIQPRKSKPRNRSNSKQKNTHVALAESFQGNQAEIAGAPSQAPVNMVPTAASAPVANLMQLAQFPPTLAGQQAQSALIATINQTINQAVQQAVTPLISHLFGTPSNIQVPSTPTLPSLSTPSSRDLVAPATDPKWFFPPLPERSFATSPAQPSPIAASRARQLLKSSPGNTEASPELPRQLPASSSSSTEERSTSDQPDSQSAQPTEDAMAPDSAAADGSNVKRRARKKKHNFSEEDNIFILEQRVVHKTPWQKIKESRVEWKDLPRSTLSNHWYLHLRQRVHELEDRITDDRDAPEPVNTTYDNDDHGPIDVDEVAAMFQADTEDDEISRAVSERTVTKEPSPDPPPNHLPTPSSLKYAENDDGPQDDEGLSEEELIQRSLAAHTHFSEDERELLSLAGVEDEDEDEEEVAAPVQVEEVVMSSPPPDEEVLPSVEIAALDMDVEKRDEKPDQEQAQDLLSLLPCIGREATPVKLEPSPDIFVTPKQLPSSGRKRQSRHKPLAFHVDLDDRGPDPNHTESTKFTCSTCKEPFKTQRTLNKHQTKPCTAQNSPVPSPSPDLISANVYQNPAPATPAIKRESITPPRLLASPTTFKTPKSAPQARGPPSSAVEGASATKAQKLDATLRIKKLWAQQGRKATPTRKVLAKRKSFAALPRKRVWDEDSGDELAL
ncbi:hypothetical protein BS50DRAFT_577220 [Corynespora cassiicola Philippines]|uniref:C2H2-type domain-containing protein n=1 Tax=Corynespora cassiicola Philippines TaxID=1448308 RepID=A0A2T2NDG2_CORCC|nr:hypothetical protein BS50DRAFT_577220 [Corynespora cassiicola Philippines]